MLHQLTQLSLLLQNEKEVHQMTCTILDQSRAFSRKIEDAFTAVLAELDFVYIQLSGANAMVNQLTNENRRLNLTMNHMVRYFALNVKCPTNVFSFPHGICQLLSRTA